MKLLHHISLRLSVLMALLILSWSIPFYYALIDEVNDETDDSLEKMSEIIIKRTLAGEELEEAFISNNNQFTIRDVSAEYAASHDHIRYEDREVYVKEMREYESARMLTTIYCDDDGNFHELEVYTPHIEKDDLRETIFKWMLTLALILLFGTMLLNTLSMRQTMKPLYNLLHWTELFRLHKKTSKLVNPTNIDEFRQLNETVEQSMLRSQKQYEIQKNFIGNASHELQTPLAVCMNQLELLMEDPALGEEQIVEIGKVIRKLRNMVQLNRTLLNLSRIENGQFTKSELVSFQNLTERILPDLQSIFTAMQIHVEMRSSSDFQHVMDPTLATMLLSNLLKNAFVHNKQGGLVIVESTADHLRVLNSGIEEALPDNQIFVPFYHTPGKHNSTGLGLPISQAICRQSGLYIKYKFSDAMHCFEIGKESSDI